MLLLHGAHDERIPVQQAKAFAEELTRHGARVELKIFASGHAIPIAQQYEEILPFLDRNVR